VSVSPGRYLPRVPKIYQLKVTLQGTHPPIWRRLLVPGNLNFERLHHVIQDAMGWDDCHLHSFDVNGVEIGRPALAPYVLREPPRPEKQYTLDRVARITDRFTYLYDFGDSWTHEIVVEEVTTGELEAPRCLAGARACPPEDCGGVWRFAELLRERAERMPEGPEGQDGQDEREGPDGLVDRVGERWSPERFDLAFADRLVARHRPQPGQPRTVSRPRGRARARA